MKCPKCGKSLKWWQPRWYKNCNCSYSNGWSVSKLNESFELDDNDVFMVSDISKKVCVKVSLKTLKDWIKQ